MNVNLADLCLVNSRVLGDRRVNEVLYPAGVRHDRHRHQTASFSFVASGRYEEHIGRNAHSRASSTLIYHPPGESHAVSFESEVRIYSVEFHGQRNWAAVADSLNCSSSHRSELVAWLGARLGREIARVDSASTLAIDGLISEMLAEGSRAKVLREEKRSAAWLARAMDYLHDNFGATFSLGDVAQIAGVHSAHLSRVFRQKMGCTVGEYVRRLRFEFACGQMLRTERPLCDVAFDAGFSDQSHFNRIFRAQMGVTPYAYRKLHRAASKNARFVQDFDQHC
ncbi:MAG TPA: AraC family transcriptional regulator [Pyrinomonadaceae bacterium]|nr:AraC family transcriptional regulator [Pyrinomonadaceae bacterium]